MLHQRDNNMFMYDENNIIIMCGDEDNTKNMMMYDVYLAEHIVLLNTLSD